MRNAAWDAYSRLFFGDLFFMVVFIHHFYIF